MNICKIYLELSLQPVEDLIRFQNWSKQDQLHSSLIDSFVIQIYFKSIPGIGSKKN